MCLSECIYVFWVCACVFGYVHICAWVCRCMCLSECMPVFERVHACVWTNACLCLNVCMPVFESVQACVWTKACLCLNESMPACIYNLIFSIKLVCTNKLKQVKFNECQLQFFFDFYIQHCYLKMKRQTYLAQNPSIILHLNLWVINIFYRLMTNSLKPWCGLPKYFSHMSPN
jgi:hypothetical protein